MEGNFDKWGSESTRTLIKRGVVKKIDGKRLYLEDGSVYFIYPGKAVYMECGSNNKFVKASYQSIGAGEEIVYSLYDDCVYMIFYR